MTDFDPTEQRRIIPDRFLEGFFNALLRELDLAHTARAKKRHILNAIRIVEANLDYITTTYK